MTKDEHIRYWADEAERSWQDSKVLYKSKRNVFTLFSWHLAIEKLLKGVWVLNNESNFPPKIHNLTRIAIECNVTLTDKRREEFEVMNLWQLEGRYPEYHKELHKIATKNTWMRISKWLKTSENGYKRKC
ncbi:MAG: HEPN domain-containing protein [Chitinophagales bacterium]|nr:HEPN domain-containing protein [Chitinophagales bacterium]